MQVARFQEEEEESIPAGIGLEEETALAAGSPSVGEAEREAGCLEPLNANHSMGGFSASLLSPSIWAESKVPPLLFCPQSQAVEAMCGLGGGPESLGLQVCQPLS